MLCIDSPGHQIYLHALLLIDRKIDYVGVGRLGRYARTRIWSKLELQFCPFRHHKRLLTKRRRSGEPKFVKNDNVERRICRKTNLSKAESVNSKLK